MKTRFFIKSSALFCLMLITACTGFSGDDTRLRVVTTTNILEDLLYQIGGDSISLQSLMGPGIDPHLYKASEGDVSRLFRADIIFYNGLHLEGKLADIFDKMKEYKNTVAVGEFLPKDKLTASKSFGGNYDPHIWFDVGFYKIMAEGVTRELAKADPGNAEYFFRNNEKYQVRLEELERELKTIAGSLPKEKRILVTAHDAFGYFGKAFDFQVVGLQGISTASEAGVSDVRNLTDFIIENRVKAIFIENSVPIRTIEALQAAVRARGHEVEIGGTLFSDSLGSPDTEEGRYPGMFRYNLTTIVNSLK